MAGRATVATAIDYLALIALLVAGSVAAATGQVGLGIAVIVIGLLAIALKISLVRMTERFEDAKPRAIVGRRSHLRVGPTGHAARRRYQICRCHRAGGAGRTKSSR